MHGQTPMFYVQLVDEVPDTVGKPLLDTCHFAEHAPRAGNTRVAVSVGCLVVEDAES